jgi:hypothetical protein
MSDKALTFYFLKYPVYNSVDFPAGTKVKLIEHRGYTSFIALDGEFKGQQGDIVGENQIDWFIEGTPANLEKMQVLMRVKKELQGKIDQLNKLYELL